MWSTTTTLYLLPCVRDEFLNRDGTGNPIDMKARSTRTYSPVRELRVIQAAQECGHCICARALTLLGVHHHYPRRVHALKGAPNDAPTLVAGRVRTCSLPKRTQTRRFSPAQNHAIRLFRVSKPKRRYSQSNNRRRYAKQNDSVFCF